MGADAPPARPVDASNLVRSVTHLLAAACTCTASLGAALHLPVRVGMGLAQLRAHVANLGTLGADVRVVRRTARHEIGTDRAHLCAIEQRNQVLGLRMVTVAVQNVRGCLRADTVTLQTMGDAFLH